MRRGSSHQYDVGGGKEGSSAAAMRRSSSLDVPAVLAAATATGGGGGQSTGVADGANDGTGVSAGQMARNSYKMPQLIEVRVH